MPKFIVTVIKTESYSTDIEIEAPTLEQAESMAEDDAREELLNWKYAETEWAAFGDLIEGGEKLWTNHYKCGCGCEWQDTWDSQCDDRCPECDTSCSPHMSCSPHESEKAPQ